MPMNMPHCRMENTALALRECLEALDASAAPIPLSELSAEELLAFYRLMKLCRQMIDSYGDD